MFGVKNIHRKFVFYGAQAFHWRRKCELLLPEIVKRKIWAQEGYKSVYEYAAKLAGMSSSVVDSALWVMGKIENKPELLKVAEKKGLNSIKPIANLVTEKTAGFWAEKAESMSKNALEAYAKEYRNRDGFVPGKPVSITMELPSELVDRLKKMKGDLGWAEFLERLVEQKKPEPVETESRHIPVAIRRYVLAKTGGKCAHCNRKADFFHHIDRFAEHNTHDPESIIPLCDGHHQLAHLGYILDERASSWRVRAEARPSEVDRLWRKYARAP